MVGVWCLAPDAQWTSCRQEVLGRIWGYASCGWATKVVKGSVGSGGSSLPLLCGVLCCHGETLWWQLNPTAERLHWLRALSSTFMWVARVDIMRGSGLSNAVADGLSSWMEQVGGCAGARGCLEVLPVASHDGSLLNGVARWFFTEWSRTMSPC